MAFTDFVSELRVLGYVVSEVGNRVIVDYEIPVGRFAGQRVRLGLTADDSYPSACPGGPHVSPPLLPMHPSQDIGHPRGGVHDDPDYESHAGGKWQYWSRPFPGWGRSDKTARSYMAHVRALFATQ